MSKPHPQIISLVQAVGAEPAHILMVVGDQMLRAEFVGNSDLNLLAGLTEHIRRKYGDHLLKPSGEV